MKANEAPEKIILSADRETGILYDEWAIRDLTDNIKIEYIRKDAIIEKTCEWLRDNYLKYSNEDCSDTKRFVTDFAYYIKKGG